jgi:hypothetical protein
MVSDSRRARVSSTVPALFRFDLVRVVHGQLSVTEGMSVEMNIHDMDIVLRMMIQINSRNCQYARSGKDEKA